MAEITYLCLYSSYTYMYIHAPEYLPTDETLCLDEDGLKKWPKIKGKKLAKLTPKICNLSCHNIYR